MFYLLFDLLVRATREGMSGQIECRTGEKYLICFEEEITSHLISM